MYMFQKAEDGGTSGSASSKEKYEIKENYYYSLGD